MRKCGKNTWEHVCIGGTGEGTRELFSSFQAALTVTGSSGTEVQAQVPRDAAGKVEQRKGGLLKGLGKQVVC